jgi:heat shock protein HslJ
MNQRLRPMLTLLGLICALLITGGAASAQTGGLPADLTGPTWTLTAIQGPAQDLQDLGSLGVTLRFGADGLAEGASTCNSYSAQATAGAGATLTFGPILSTKRACVEESRMNLETEYFTALQGVSAYTLQGTQLRLTYNNGSSFLEFTSTPAPGMPTTGGPNLGLTLAILAAGALLLVAGGLGLRRARLAR